MTPNPFSHPTGILGMIAELQDLDRYREQHWEGSFSDYLELVRERPSITRNAYQRLYDMIVSFGTETYTEYKKPIVRYKFFDDPVDNGKDAIFGIDVHLMKLVNVLKSAALSLGPERRVILLHGPVGSAKSTIARLFKKVDHQVHDEGSARAAGASFGDGRCSSRRDGERLEDDGPR